MPTPIIGLFTESNSETQFSLVLVLALELMELGKRVVLVDADPVRAPFAEISGAPVPPGVSFLGLLHNPEAKPLLIDCGPALGNPAALARGGAMHLVPARAGAETADARLLAQPPLQGARRFVALAESLALAAQGFDVVLLVGAVGRSTLVTRLLAQACHAALLIADNTAKQVLWLAQTAREADALRGGLIPSTCVETRDDGNAVPEGAWQELWRTHPGLLPPHRRGEEGPERLLILEDSKDDASRLARAVLDLAQYAQSGAGPLPDDAAFQALYQEDRAHALALFDGSMAPRLGTRASAIAALRAVWESEDRRWEDVQHLAKFVVQKFRWEEPTPEAQELLPIYDALAGAAERGDIAEGHARVLIDRAGMLTHVAAWRLEQGQDVRTLAAECEGLLAHARSMQRSVSDRARSAEVLALCARLSGSAVHYNLALEEVAEFVAAVAPVKGLRRLVTIASAFAQADPSLWERVLALCKDLVPLDPRFACWYGAIALAHQNRPWEALDLLYELRQVDREAFRMAFADPELKLLWNLGGNKSVLQQSPPDFKR